MMPYFAGTKNALCVPIRNTHTIKSTALIVAMVSDEAQPTSAVCGSKNAINASSVMLTSATFQKTIVRPLAELVGQDAGDRRKQKERSDEAGRHHGQHQLLVDPLQVAHIAPACRWRKKSPRSGSPGH